MKRIFKLENLDCASCAAKMERAIEKIKGVKEVSVSFMTQRLTIEAADEMFEDIIEMAAKACARIEPDCRIKS